MNSIFRRIQHMGLGPRLSLINFVCVTFILLVLVSVIGWAFMRTMEDKQEDELRHGITMLGNFIKASDQDLTQRTQFLSNSFNTLASGHFALTASSGQPVLTLDGKPLNGDTMLVDRFTQATGAVATLFARQGDDFLRVTTSLKNAQGQRAMGTLLGKNHPAYATVSAGQPFTGLATLFGRRYMTHYTPIKDASGQVIALAFIGVDFSEFLENLKASIRSLKIGESGYYYVLDQTPGESYGTLIVHPAQEGKNILGSKAGDGREFIREILEKKQGLINYPWLNPGETKAREKIVVFDNYSSWNWVFAAGAYVDEFSAGVTRQLTRFALMGLVGVLLLSGALYLMVRHMITRPLTQAVQLADAVAQGDISQHIGSDARDEMGQLLRALGAMSDHLRRVVSEVRAGVESVNTAASEIASGDVDLSARTEQTAANLEQTAASLEELTATIGQSAETAQQANQLVTGAAQTARKGGDVMQQVITSMGEITDSSRKINDIIGVIDNIAFQTNILALNAAVEAARAGEQGRGFAVVAGEVRTLAQRSAEAAREIKALITTSVQNVENGSAQVDQAGHSMGEIVSSVNRVSDMIGEISTAAVEQRDGLNQVNQAVTNLDQMTQQNAALVEQTAAAASSMRDQAERLTRAVEAFHLGDTEEHLIAAAHAAHEQRKAERRAQRQAQVAGYVTKHAPALPHHQG